ncbi:hypothetical protein FGO68_gene557 [Halteria grandinella]|uniref:Uncharacterized protein n=1 Tax=Halteria grandinella TaxID=5974 RepID=A0A8J8P0B2_HALGN|nr:hypothetical protein FGO68_gene557 [Halteria grandinella]
MINNHSSRIQLQGLNIRQSDAQTLSVGTGIQQIRGEEIKQPLKQLESYIQSTPNVMKHLTAFLQSRNSLDNKQSTNGNTDKSKKASTNGLQFIAQEIRKEARSVLEQEMMLSQQIKLNKHSGGQQAKNAASSNLYGLNNKDVSMRRGGGSLSPRQLMNNPQSLKQLPSPTSKQSFLHQTTSQHFQAIQQQYATLETDKQTIKSNLSKNPIKGQTQQIIPPTKLYKKKPIQLPPPAIPPSLAAVGRYSVGGNTHIVAKQHKTPSLLSKIIEIASNKSRGGGEGKGMIITSTGAANVSGDKPLSFGGEGRKKLSFGGGAGSGSEMIAGQNRHNRNYSLTIGATACNQDMVNQQQPGNQFKRDKSSLKLEHLGSSQEFNLNHEESKGKIVILQKIEPIKELTPPSSKKKSPLIEPTSPYAVNSVIPTPGETNFLLNLKQLKKKALIKLKQNQQARNKEQLAFNWKQAEQTPLNGTSINGTSFKLPPVGSGMTPDLKSELAVSGFNSKFITPEPKLQMQESHAYLLEPNQQTDQCPSPRISGGQTTKVKKRVIHIENALSKSGKSLFQNQILASTEGFQHLRKVEEFPLGEELLAPLRKNNELNLLNISRQASNTKPLNQSINLRASSEKLNKASIQEILNDFQKELSQRKQRNRPTKKEAKYVESKGLIIVKQLNQRNTGILNQDIIAVGMNKQTLDLEGQELKRIRKTLKPPQAPIFPGQLGISGKRNSSSNELNAVAMSTILVNGHPTHISISPSRIKLDEQTEPLIPIYIPGANGPITYQVYMNPSSNITSSINKQRKMLLQQLAQRRGGSNRFSLGASGSINPRDSNAEISPEAAVQKTPGQNLVQVIGRTSLLNRPKQIEILEQRKFALEEYKDPDFIPLKDLKKRLQFMKMEKIYNSKLTFNEWQQEQQSYISEFQKSDEDDAISSHREGEDDETGRSRLVLESKGIKDMQVLEALDRLKNASLKQILTRASLSRFSSASLGGPLEKYMIMQKDLRVDEDHKEQSKEESTIIVDQSNMKKLSDMNLQHASSLSLGPYQPIYISNERQSIQVIVKKNNEVVQIPDDTEYFETPKQNNQIDPKKLRVSRSKLSPLKLGQKRSNNHSSMSLNPSQGSGKNKKTSQVKHQQHRVTSTKKPASKFTISSPQYEASAIRSPLSHSQTNFAFQIPGGDHGDIL